MATSPQAGPAPATHTPPPPAPPKPARGGHQFQVLPTQAEYLELDRLCSSHDAGTPAGREALRLAWLEYRDLERHEDNLFQGRFQALLVSTSFLAGAFFSITGAPMSALVARLGLCCAGLVFTFHMRAVMIRAARAIEWYLAFLIRLDALLHPEGLQPYRSRRLQAGRLDSQNRPIGGRTVMSRMAVLFPNGILALWVFFALVAGLFFLSAGHPTHAAPAHRPAPRAIPVKLPTPRRSVSGTGPAIPFTALAELSSSTAMAPST